MGGVLDLAKGILGGKTSGEKSAERAARGQEEAAFAGIEEQRRQFDITQERLQEAQRLQQEQLAPFREAGAGALQQQQALLGLLGSRRQEQAFAAFQESPGQQFLRERQEKALLRGASAIGGLGGGNVRTALQQQAAGFASQDIQNQLNRLAALSGAGQAAAGGIGQGALGTAGQVGQFGAQAAGNIGQLQQAAGQARASGILGAQQVRAQQQGQLLGAAAGAGAGALGLLGGGVGAGGGALLGLLSDARFKTNVKRVGTLDNGLPWYTWEWTEEGKAIAGDQPTFGVMAHEAEKMYPDAVIEVDGIKRVLYGRLH